MLRERVKKRVVWMFAIGSLGAAACSGGGTSPRSDAGPAGEAGGDADAEPRLLDALEEGYCRPLAAWLCERAEACGCMEGSSRFPVGAACRDRLRARCVDRIRRLLGDPSLEGRLRVDRDAMAACLAAHRDAPPCELPSAERVGSICAGVIFETAALGEPCRHAICDEGRGFCREGRCEARSGPGEPCSAPERCRAPLRCVEGSCREAASIGEPCSSEALCVTGAGCVEGRCTELAPEGAPCGSDAACQEQLRCLDGRCRALPASCDPLGEPAACGARRECLVPNERRCTPFAEEGEPCTRTAQCRTGLYCDPDGGSCRPAPGQEEPCADGVHCAEGLACDFERLVCVPVPGMGEPCALGERGPNVCAEGLACLRDGGGASGRFGTCGPLPDEGEACAAEARCAEGLACDFLSDGRNLCIPPKGEGEPCMASFACGEGLFCDLARQRCMPRLPEGAACGGGERCGEGLDCLPASDGGDLRCLPLPVEGERCVEACASGLLCRQHVRSGRCLPSICTLPVGMP